MAKLFFVVVSFLFAGVIAQSSITLTGTCRDFTPAHPDFEHYLGSEPGAIESSLDMDDKPILKSGSHATFTSVQDFAEWYRDVDGVNIPFTITITLTETSAGSGVYSYSNDAFFPIDGEGYGNYGSTGHNFHFTTEFQNTFTYVGGEVFSFTGDDDVFVFIGDNLVIDLGGVHGAQSASVNLDDLGLTVGNDYNLYVFQAERHTSESHFRIDTSVQLVSQPPDDGGVTSPGRDAYICEVLYENFCEGSTQGGSIRAGDCPDDPYIQFTAGGDYYSFENFNGISFGNFYAPSSDIEGRLAIAGDLNLPQGGYSVGYELRTGGVAAWDQHLPFSLVVGGDAVFNGGAVYPDGTDYPYPGDREDIYVGGTFTAPQYLQDRRTGGPNPGFLDASFQNAQAYYTALSAAWATAPQGEQAQASIQYQGLTISCSSSSASAYYVNIQAQQFSTVTWWTEVNCNPLGQIVLNILGDSSKTVLFQGGNFEHKQEKVLYNIYGPGKVKVITEVRGTILAPQSVYNQPNNGVVKGHVIVADVTESAQINRLHCATPAPPPHPPSDESLCPAWEGECSGLTFPLGNAAYSFRDFGIVSFNNFVANTGDTEARVAAKNDFTVGNGFSVGYELQTAGNQPDNELPYAVVAGRDVVWGSGEVYPNGLGFPYPGAAEGIFAGRNFTGPDYLWYRRTGGPCASAGCLDTYFDAAQTCYAGFQNDMAQNADTVTKEIYWSGLFITCNDEDASVYYMTLTPEEMAQYTYYSTSGCNLQAYWVINVVGDDDVNFAGDSFPAIPGGVVWNIQGSGRTINVNGISVTGHILAPGNTLNQIGGVIVGKVVVADIMMSLQINKQNTCPQDGSVSIRTTATGSSNGNTASVYRVGGFMEGDDVSGPGGQTATVISVSNGSPATITFDSPMTLNEGDILIANISRSLGRVTLTKPETSSENNAVAIQISFALFALIALFA